MQVVGRRWRTGRRWGRIRGWRKVEADGDGEDREVCG